MHGPRSAHQASPAGATAVHPLERLLAPVSPVAISDPPWTTRWSDRPPAIECRLGKESPAWLTGDDVRLFCRVDASRMEGGREVASFRLLSGQEVKAFQPASPGPVVIPFSLGEVYQAFVAELWTSGADRRALTPAALNAFYRVKRAIPSRLRLAGRRALIAWQGSPEFPSWPFDASVAKLLNLYLLCALVGSDRDEIDFRWFWPQGARAAAILTHDIESEEGLRNALRIADLEQERELRSSFNIVAAQYDVDMGIVRELLARGFEIGVHGLAHDRSLFSSYESFLGQQPLLREAVARFGADGFRSPSTHRVHKWLGELPVKYDCTVPMSDPYEPQPGGCCSPWPFFIGSVVELPYTLPQDHLLFTLLRHRTIDAWTDQVKDLEHSFGLIQCLSHPDPGYLGDRRIERLYVKFLDVLREREGIWHALPREVAHWWRERDAARDHPVPADTGRACLDASGRVIIVGPE
jgi:peptidoglycan/xylan/chitin deacetylase (PgdA/CDA1 family)